MQEYSEEIERLRRDLMAMYEKDGVYLAHENYQELKAKLEAQEQEIIDRMSFIQRLEKDFEEAKVSYCDAPER